MNDFSAQKAIIRKQYIPQTWVIKPYSSVLCDTVLFDVTIDLRQNEKAFADIYRISRRTHKIKTRKSRMSKTAQVLQDFKTIRFLRTPVNHKRGNGNEKSKTYKRPEVLAKKRK